MEKQSTSPHNVIGQRLFRQSLLIALVLTVLLTLLQVWMNYRDAYEAMLDTLENIEAVQAEAISTALWNISMPEIIAQNEGIVNYPFITFAAVYEDENLITQAGTKKTEGFLAREITLDHRFGGEDVFTIGKLYIQADTSAVYDVVLSQIGRIFIFQALNVFLVMLLILVLIDRRVTRYLVAAADYFNNVGKKALDDPLQLDKTRSSDEIDSLVDSFNNMRSSLFTAVRQQYESERRYATLLSNLPGMAFRCQNDRRWKFELVSAGCLQITGYSEDELAGSEGLGLSHFIHPADYSRVWDDIQTSLIENRQFELSYRILTRSQQEKWVWQKGTGIYEENGELRFIEGFIADITEKMQQEREIEAIAATSYALRTAGSRDEILSVILEQTVELLHADGASLELIDTDNDEVVIELAHGIYERFAGHRFKPQRGSRNAVRTSGEFCINTHDEEAVHIYPYEEALCSAICGVPMIAHDQRIGFLWIGWMNQISENVVRSLAAIADIAANAIYRAGLFEKTEHQLRELIGLRKIDDAINSNQELSDTLQILLEQTAELLKVDAANIILMDENTHIYTYEIGMGFNQPGVRQSYLPVMDVCAGKIALSRNIQKICNISETKPGQKCEEIMQQEGFKAYFAAPLITQNEVKGILQVFHRKALYPDDDWLGFLQALAGQAAIAVSKAHLIQNLQQSNLELQLAYDETIAGWSNALDLRDKETEGHSQRVTDLTLVLALMLGIKGEELVHIRRGSLLHDIGKMGVPDQILLKPGPLSEEEWVIMRQHPGNAFKLLSPIEHLYPALDIPYYHHEKWDGTGYPNGLKGEEIPLAARIFAVVDVWDALTSDRPYRKALSVEESLEYIVQQSGHHFDPDVVSAFLRIRRENTPQD